jgi:hypothetical protein
MSKRCDECAQPRRATGMAWAVAQPRVVVRARPRRSRRRDRDLLPDPRSMVAACSVAACTVTEGAPE